MVTYQTVLQSGLFCSEGGQFGVLPVTVATGDPPLVLSTVTVAEYFPFFVGENATWIVHVVPAARVVPHVVPATENGGARGTTLTPVAVAVPVFISDNVTVLVWPFFTLPAV